MSLHEQGVAQQVRGRRTRRERPTTGVPRGVGGLDAINQHGGRRELGHKLEQPTIRHDCDGTLTGEPP